MTILLVQYYNLIVQKQYYPTRWLKTLDITIEKGKGPVIRKLRTIQLIEADLQILMIIFINERNSGRIEIDPMISKYNYGSRKGYSIENAILEKRIVYNNSLLMGNHTIHNMTDLQSCYNS